LRKILLRNIHKLFKIKLIKQGHVYGKIASQKDLILEIIARFPQGASVEEVLIGLSPPPSRRTLQYRLASLVRNGDNDPVLNIRRLEKL
jgi:hypothetical protein